MLLDRMRFLLLGLSLVSSYMLIAGCGDERKSDERIAREPPRADADASGVTPDSAMDDGGVLSGGASNGSDAGRDSGGDARNEAGGAFADSGGPSIGPGMWDCSGETSSTDEENRRHCECVHFPDLDPIEGVPNQCLNAWSCCYAARYETAGITDWLCLCVDSDDNCDRKVESAMASDSPFDQAVRLSSCPP